MSNEYQRPAWEDVMAKVDALSSDQEKGEYLREVIERDREHTDGTSPLQMKMGEEQSLTAKQKPSFADGGAGASQSNIDRRPTSPRFPRQAPAGNPPRPKEEREYEAVEENLEGPLNEQLQVLSAEMVKADKGLQPTIEEDMIERENQLLDQIRDEEKQCGSPSEKVGYLEGEKSKCEHLAFEVSWPETPLRNPFQIVADQIARRLNYWQQHLPRPQGEAESQPDLDEATGAPFPFQHNKSTLRYIANELYVRYVETKPKTRDKVEFFRRFISLFKDKDDNQQYSERDIEQMLKKVGTPPYTARDIDEMFEEAENQGGASSG